MDSLIRSMGDHLHALIQISEKLKKDLPELEAKAAAASEKAAEYDRIDRRAHKRAAELEELSQKYSEVHSKIKELKESL